MNPVDLIELDVLDITGDIALAEQAGRIAVEAIRDAVIVVADVTGLDPYALIADTLTALGI